MTYRITQHKLSQTQGSLVDRGANGGLLGDDVWIFAWTEKYVDVAGLNNHQEHGLRIASGAAIIETNCGPHVGVFHQYAFLGKGKTIHSCGQMEMFGLEVNDKSHIVGGKQCINTPDGIVIPLSFRQGLPYLNMYPCNEELFHKLPHIVFTSDLEWDPAVWTMN